MRISDWSSDVCSSDLIIVLAAGAADRERIRTGHQRHVAVAPGRSAAAAAAAEHLGPPVGQVLGLEVLELVRDPRLPCAGAFDAFDTTLYIGQVLGPRTASPHPLCPFQHTGLKPS